MWRFTQGSVRREIGLFLVLAFGLSWTPWITGIALTGGPNNDLTGLGIYGPAFAGMLLSYSGERRRETRLSARVLWFLLFWVICSTALYFGNRARLLVAIPALLPAWILSGAFSRDRGVHGFLETLVRPRRWGWQIISLATFAVFLLTKAAIAIALGRAILPPALTGWSAVAAFALAFVAGGGVSEEPGWRGYLLPRFQSRMSPLAASFAVWLPWALWHLPLDAFGYVGPLWQEYLYNRVFLLIPLSVIMTWLYNRSGGTILSAALFHTAFNTFPDVLPHAPGMNWLLYVWAGVVVVWGYGTATVFKARS